MADLAEEAAHDLVRRASSAHRPPGDGLLGAYRAALDLVLRLKAELEARGESLGGEGVGAGPPRPRRREATGRPDADVPAAGGPDPDAG